MCVNIQEKILGGTQTEPLTTLCHVMSFLHNYFSSDTIKEIALISLIESELKLKYYECVLSSTVATATRESKQWNKKMLFPRLTSMVSKTSFPFRVVVNNHYVPDSIQKPWDK